MPTDDENQNSILPQSPDAIYLAARVQEMKKGQPFDFSFKMPAKQAFYFLEKAENQGRLISFFCPVCDSTTGEFCPAKIKPVKKENKKGKADYYFETVNGSNHHHIFNQEEYIISDEVIYNPSSFLEYLLNDKKRTKRDNKTDEIRVYNHYWEVPVLPLKTVQPRNVEEYYIQTRTHNMRMYMPNAPDSNSNNHITYGEYLLNKDTVISFRSGFYGFGMPVLVLAEAINQRHPIVFELKRMLYNSNIVVLKDPFPISKKQKDNDRLYFVINCFNKEKCKQGKKYLVLCNWETIKKATINNKEYKIVQGIIEKESQQIMFFNESLYNRFETQQD